MKRFVQAIFLLASALALGFALYFIIEGRSGATEAARPVATRQVQPESRSASSQGGAVSIEPQPNITHIPALPNEVILSVSSFNIDQDQSEEQILTVRKTDNTDGKLSIVVADYNEQKKIWFRSWQFLYFQVISRPWSRQVGSARSRWSQPRAPSFRESRRREPAR